MNTETTKKYSLDEICALVDLPKRTVRFYIQKNLVDRPVGQKKGASYGNNHLEQLLTIKKWQAAGLSLDRIAELLKEPDMANIPSREREAGSIEVWSHIYLAEGVELHIDPTQAGLNPEMLRSFTKMVLDAYKTIIEKKENEK